MGLLISENNKRHGTYIDGVFAAEVIDGSAEIIRIKGIDISRAVDGFATVNWEHESDPMSVVGRVIYIKKIYSRLDCDNDRQLKYWEELEVPYLYGVAELFDAEDPPHIGAQSVVAMLRNYARNNIPCVIRWSIEGKTFARNPLDKSELLGTIMTAVAATIKPCNRACDSGVIDNIHSVLPGKPNEHPKIESPTLKKHYITSFEVVCNPLMEPIIPLKLIFDNLNKALTAGMTSAAPSSLTQGDALQKEYIVGREEKKKKEQFIKNQILAAVRDWDRSESLDKHLLKKVPEASPEYIAKFVELVEKRELIKQEYLDNLIDKIDAIEIEDLNKHKLTPDFPKLGVKAYGSTPIVDPKGEHVQRKLMEHVTGQKFQDAFKQKYSAEHGYPEASKELASQLMDEFKGVYGLTQAKGGDVHSYAKEGSIDPIGTQLHENFHGTMRLIDDKHGQGASRRVLSHIYDSMPEHAKKALDIYLKHRSTGRSQNTEEKFAHLIHFLNSPKEREWFRNKLGEHGKGPEGERIWSAFDNAMKNAYRHLQHKAKKVSFK